MSWAGYLLTLAVLYGFYRIADSVIILSAMIAIVLVPFISWGMLWISRKKLRLELSAPATGQKGSDLSVCVSLVKRTVFPVGKLDLTLILSNSITRQRVRTKITDSQMGNLNLKSDYCGCLSVRVQNARVYDLFGLMWVKLPKPKDKRIVIMPDTFPVLIQQSAYPAPVDDCEDYAPNRKGQDRTETYQIRNYVPGDSLAQIHWKLSSKLDTLMVRDPGCPLDQNLMVFVDRSWGDIEPAQADCIMEAAVSVCQSLSEEAVSYQLVWNEETIHSQNVTEQDMLPEAVSALLKSKTPSQTIPGTDVYLGLHGPAKVSRMIYIGTQIPDSLEEFAGHSHVVRLLCGNAGDEEGVISFAPGNYEEALAQVSWS